MNINYEDISRTYDKHRSYSASEVEAIIHFADIKAGMRILDLGCGTGNLASQLLKVLDVDIVGADISLPMLSVARGKSLDVLCADAGSGRLPFPDESFDRVIIAYVLHQINSLVPLFAECYRILRSGVLVIFTSSHRQIESTHAVPKDFFPGLIDADKARFPDIPVIDRHLDAAGFRDIRHRELRRENIPMDDAYLARIKGKYVSTFHLLPQDEFEKGVARLEVYIRNSRQTIYREWRGTLLHASKYG